MTWGLPSGLTVASQAVCRSGPHVSELERFLSAGASAPSPMELWVRHNRRGSSWKLVLSTQVMANHMLYESICEDDVKNEQGRLGARRLFASNGGAAGSRVPTFRSDPSKSLFL